MTVLQIITDPKKLSRICEPVTEHAESIARDLLDTAERHRARCLGLAAPQIGYNVRMFVMLNEGKFIVIINPEIFTTKGEKRFLKEGCLSRPGVSVRVPRFKRIKVKYTDADGETIERNFNNLNARIFQHELDHLNGVLI